MNDKYQTEQESRRMAFLLKTVLRRPVILLFSILSLASPHMYAQSGNAIITLISDDGPFLNLNDTITFTIEIDTRGDKIFGAEAYISIPDTLLTLVLSETNAPFIPGTWIQDPPQLNKIWNDSENAFTGIQINYSQFDLDQTYSGVGTLAQFKVVPHTIPDNDSASLTISFDMFVQNARFTKYLVETEYGTAAAAEFNQVISVTMQVAGAEIRPAIPDTNITPGDGYSIDLTSHFSSGAYVITDPGVVWTWTPISTPAGVNVVPDFANYLIDITTLASSHGLLEFDLFMEATGSPQGDYSDAQRVTITVDDPPVFDQPLLPTDFTFSEDTVITRATSTLFTDPDDRGAAITLWLVPNSPVQLSYDNSDNFTLTPDPDYFGVDTARLFVQDGLGLAIDTLLQFTVTAVNDTPVVNLDNFAGGLRDTLITHRSVTDSVDLSLYTVDVDDPVLVYTTNDLSADSLDLTLNLSGSGLMSVSAAANAQFSDHAVIITATDTSGAFDSDTLVISVRSWPPVIDSLIADIIIVAGNPDTVSLSPLVTDLDTDDSVLVWSFEVQNFADSSIIDTNVDVTNYNAAAQTLEIVTQPGYAALDRLIFYVQDDNGNRDTSFARLAIFSTLNPVIFPFPIDTVFIDQQKIVLDLDDFVIDPLYTPAELTWSATGGDRLDTYTIGASDHLLTVTANPTFFGWDTITFIVENPDTLRDTASLVLRILPEFDMPPSWLTFREYEVVYPDTTDIGLLTDFAVDDYSAPEELIYGVFPNPDVSKPLDVIIDSTIWEIRMTATTAQEFLTWILFTAEDIAGQIDTSDTVWVSVQDSYSPVWSTIPTLQLGLNETFIDTLSRYLSDKDTPLSSITVSALANRSDVIVTYDPVTTAITYLSKTIESTVDITYTAIDDNFNVAVTSNTVIVRIPVDTKEPEALTTYYFHPVQKRRIEYLLIADSTAAKISSIYILNDRERPLTLVRQDSTGSTFVWFGQDKMELAGLYRLITEVSDLRNNVLRMSLSLSLDFSKKIGGQITSANGKLSASYPATAVPEGHLIIISSSHEGNGGGPGLSKELGDIEYSLDTNLPEELLMTVRHQQAGDDSYFAFYDISGGSRQRLTTYKAGPDTYEAYVTTGKTITFGESPVRAEAALPTTASLWTHPNPFNATLQMRFMLRLPDRAQVKIFNLLGQEVFSTARTDFAPGIHSVAWHGRDKLGRQVASGIYFVQLITERGPTQLRKVTLLK